ncbi:hypothetical protein SBD_7610 [Streptomyces bottropensis ATCC 25435]|uniref:Uncharacterized protein n=1 Tax=Streptomyces bottropensis ATCC 25435 TaxID=1054862 RepID=M3E4S6_9ACTN|nr:hypothetical protein SBD_7610 [Streptomyces bottropensis ATCC 25435]
MCGGWRLRCGMDAEWTAPRYGVAEKRDRERSDAWRGTAPGRFTVRLRSHGACFPSEA